tara:strand:- start:565 stop:1986 length:1422 start_codon:yes stop_codon:yes gene_type:complete
MTSQIDKYDFTTNINQINNFVKNYIINNNNNNNNNKNSDTITITKPPIYNNTYIDDNTETDNNTYTDNNTETDNNTYTDNNTETDDWNNILDNIEKNTDINIININDDANTNNFSNTDYNNINYNNINYKDYINNVSNKLIYNNNNNNLNITNINYVDNICNNCNNFLDNNINISICNFCGTKYHKENHTNIFNLTNSTDYNTIINSFTTFKVFGPNSYNIQKNLLRVNSNYKKYSKNLEYTKLMNLIYYTFDGKTIPKNVLKDSINIYTEIKNINILNKKNIDKKLVFRGANKKGVLLACVFVACRINKITKTSKYLCKATNTDEKYLSKGKNLIFGLICQKILILPNFNDPIIDYINQYFQILNIDDKYKQFIIDIIYKAKKKKINILIGSRDNTKVIGTIYLLVKRVKNLNHITHNIISEDLDISKTTFIKYYNILCNNFKIFKNIFKKHKIPMQNNWSEKWCRDNNINY